MMQRQTHQVTVLESDESTALTHQTNDRLQRGGFSGTIATQNGDGLAFVDMQIDSMQYMAFSIPSVETAYLQQGTIHVPSPSRLHEQLRCD